MLTTLNNLFCLHVDGLLLKNSTDCNGSIVTVGGSLLCGNVFVKSYDQSGLISAGCPRPFLSIFLLR